MQPDQALDRLILLTLSIEEAVRREAFQEMEVLFHHREMALTDVERLQIPKTHPKVALLLEADARLGLILATRSESVVSEIRKVSSSRKAQRAYSHAA